MTTARADHHRGLSRRRFLKNAAAAGSLAAYGCSSGKQPRPNILWIIAEDFCPDLGCYGDRLVQTPHIDRLAADGVRYSNAIMTAPVCSAARSALMTGMYQTSIGAHNHRSHRGDGYRLPGNVRPFTHYLREAGYHTSNVTTPAAGLKGTGKTDLNFEAEQLFDGSDWSERQEGQRFYAQVNFSETHRPFHRFPDRPIDPAQVTLPSYYPDHPAVRQDWALYLETAQRLDRKVGQVLARLDEERLSENTVVFFFADHGRPMPRGKQFLYEGGIHIPLIVRLPAKFRPEGFEPGGLRDDLISSIDITATTLLMAGVDPPAHLEGQPFLGAEVRGRDFVMAARDRCDETVDRIRAVRTKRFKYIRNFFLDRPYNQQNIYKDTSYPPLQVMRQLHEEGKLTVAQGLFMSSRRPEEELYDLEADPNEVNNLAGSPGVQPTLERLREMLHRWIEESGDQGAIPEDPLPADTRLRTQVDGWSTSDGILSKQDGVLRMEWSGKRNRLTLPFVMAGEPLVVRVRAKSSSVRPRSFFWGTVDNVPGEGNQREIDFAADRRWHDVSVAFEPSGYMANFGFDFREASGTIEFDWVRLYRRSGRNLRLIKQWTFA